MNDSMEMKTTAEHHAAQPTNPEAAFVMTFAAGASIGMKISAAPIWKPTERLCVGPDGRILQAWIEMVSGHVELRRLPTADELMRVIPGLVIAEWKSPT